MLEYTKPGLRRMMAGALPGPNVEGVRTEAIKIINSFKGLDIIGYKALPGEIPLDDLGLEVVNRDLDAAISRGGDVFIIPMLAWNDRGYRLGRGGGFYDRLLNALPEALAVGVASNYRRASFKEDIFDVRMDVIVTERGL